MNHDATVDKLELGGVEMPMTNPNPGTVEHRDPVIVRECPQTRPAAIVDASAFIGFGQVTYRGQ